VLNGTSSASSAVSGCFMANKMAERTTWPKNSLHACSIARTWLTHAHSVPKTPKILFKILFEIFPKIIKLAAIIFSLQSTEK
jgi:hypothetical protein